MPNTILEDHIRVREPLLHPGYGEVARFLYKEAAKPGATILELGCCQTPGGVSPEDPLEQWHGDFVIPFLLGAQDGGGHVDGVNIEPCPCLEALVDKLALRDVWAFHLMDDTKWLPACRDSYDLILVDTIEEYKHVLFELNEADRLLNHEGTILVHDTLLHMGNVAEAVLSFLARHQGAYAYHELPVCYGLGILRQL